MPKYCKKMICTHCGIEFMAAANKRTSYCTGCTKTLGDQERLLDPDTIKKYQERSKKYRERKKIEKESSNG